MGRYQRSHARKALAGVLVVVVALVRWLVDAYFPDSTAGPTSPRGDVPPGTYAVERVVDGDTLLLVKRHVRVRLQGIDTPEIANESHGAEPLADEAMAFTQRFVRDAGGALRLEFDGETVDRHGRTLAFCWDDGRMLNEELVRAGLARARLHYDYSQPKKDRMRRAQQEAQRAARGVWSARQTVAAPSAQTTRGPKRRPREVGAP